MKLPAWADRMQRKELGRGDIDMLMTALAIAWEALETVGYAQGDGHPLALMKKARKALRRIEEIGK